MAIGGSFFTGLWCITTSAIRQALTVLTKEGNMIRLALLLAILCGAVPAAAQTATVTLPDVMGPIPVTATSVPLMASNKLQTLVDLPKAGYIEEEFFITGRANIYDWAANGGVTVKTPNAPYTTRIMLR